MHCEGSLHADWIDGYFNIQLSAPIDRTVTKVRVEITNTLD
jgi:hypothetical protein